MRRFLVVATVFLLSACGSSAIQPKTSTPTPIPNTTVPTTTVPRTTPTVPVPNALDQLAAFVAAARTLDSQLHAAAQAINGAGPPWQQVSTTVAEAVTAADLDPVTAVIPAGLPQPLLQQTILVYSDLVSRRMSMRFFGYAGPAPIENQQWMLSSLGDGAPAAARFQSDLSHLIVLAQSTGPFTVASPTSIQAADRDLLVQFVELSNSGCMTTGGQVYPTLPAITWTTPTSGQVGQVNFTATLVGTTWKIVLRAC